MVAEPSIGNILRLIYFVLRFQQTLDTFPKQTLLALVIDDQQGDDDSNGDDIRIKYINQVQGASRPLQN